MLKNNPIAPPNIKKAHEEYKKNQTPYKQFKRSIEFKEIDSISGERPKFAPEETDKFKWQLLRVNIVFKLLKIEEEKLAILFLRHEDTKDVEKEIRELNVILLEIDFSLEKELVYNNTYDCLLDNETETDLMIRKIYNN